MNNSLNLVVLIPAYNEAATIADVVKIVQKYVNAVLVIDDGSTDDTATLAHAAGAKCISLESNVGKGLALRCGLETIQDQQFTHVLFMDGDGQHNPHDIPVMIETTEKTNADMVIGTRKFEHNKMPRERFLSNNIGSKITSWMVKMKIQDSQSGFRLIRKKALDSLNLKSRKYEFEMEVLIKLWKNGAKITHAPINMVYGNKNQSKMKPVRDTVRICFYSLFFRYLDH